MTSQIACNLRVSFFRSPDEEDMRNTMSVQPAADCLAGLPNTGVHARLWQLVSTHAGKVLTASLS